MNDAIGRFFASVDTGEFLDDPTALEKAADEVTQAQLAWWGKMAPVTTEVSADGNTYIERRPVGALQWGTQAKEGALGVARAVAGETAGTTAAREFAKGTARSSAQ